MPYIPTGFETLPNILYQPLLHLQPLQFYEIGLYFAKQKKFELALRYLDWVSEPMVNPDHLPVKKALTRNVDQKAHKKKIEICCMVRMFKKARQELEALRKLTGKPFKKLQQMIDDAFWTAALEQLELEEKMGDKLPKPRNSVVKGKPSPTEAGGPAARWSLVSLAGDSSGEIVDRKGWKRGVKSDISEEKRLKKAVKGGKLSSEQSSSMSGNVTQKGKNENFKEKILKSKQIIESISVTKESSNGKKYHDGTRESINGKETSSGGLCLSGFDSVYDYSEDEEVDCTQNDPSDDEEECKKAWKLGRS